MDTTVNTTPAQDLYPDLGPEQRAYLDQEWRPSRSEVAELGPYPVTPELAATAKYLQRYCVLPWDQVRVRHLRVWHDADFIARGARPIPLFTPVLMATKFKLFRRIGDARKYWAGEDYQHGFSNVPDEEY